MFYGQFGALEQIRALLNTKIGSLIVEGRTSQPSKPILVTSMMLPFTVEALILFSLCLAVETEACSFFRRLVRNYFFFKQF